MGQVIGLLVGLGVAACVGFSVPGLVGDTSV